MFDFWKMDFTAKERINERHEFTGKGGFEIELRPLVRRRPHNAHTTLSSSRFLCRRQVSRCLDSFLVIFQAHIVWRADKEKCDQQPMLQPLTWWVSPCQASNLLIWSKPRFKMEERGRHAINPVFQSCARSRRGEGVCLWWIGG